MPHHRDPVYGKFNKKLDPILLFKLIAKQKVEVFFVLYLAWLKQNWIIEMKIVSYSDHKFVWFCLCEILK